MEKLKLVRNDRRPIIEVSITDATTGNPIDISGATPRLYFRLIGSETLKATVVGVLVTGKVEDDGSITTTTPYDVAGVGGRCQFTWGATDLDTAGDYEGEIEITFADGTKQTAYDKIPFKVREDFA
jgi:hypothetical protein